MADSERNIWADYDPDAVLAAVEKTAGSWADVDGDALPHISAGQETPPAGRIGGSSASGRGARNQQTARAGEFYVAAELNRRGAYAVPFAGNMPGVDILASDVNRKRLVFLQVKTRRVGTWHAGANQGSPMVEDPDESEFWVLVDLGKHNGEPPDYYIVPNWWMRNNIYEVHEAYLKRHGGEGARALWSNHHGIELKHVTEWKNAWASLRLF